MSMRLFRRISQLTFLALFIYLFITTRFPHEGFIPSDLFLQASPLIAIAIFLASRTLIASMTLGIIVLVMTIPFGRLFCGWICPLGTVIDANDKLINRKKISKANPPSTRFRSWKYFLLTFVLVTALFSTQFVGYFDPIALLIRTTTLTIFPAFVSVVNAVFSTLFNSDVFPDQVYSVYTFAQNSVLPLRAPNMLQSIVVFSIFAAILALGLVSRRFWCRNLCPLGALLGIFSRIRIFNRNVSESCTSCSICQTSCRMNAIEDDYTLNNSVECIHCGECESLCKPGSVNYRFEVPRGENKVDLNRRKVLQASFSGIVGLAVMNSSATLGGQSGKAIRPPGSIEEEQFLDRCVRCQACVRICASTGGCLQPALNESGWLGIWTPIAVPALGYCEYNCKLCSEVCPTGAIQELTLEEKKKLVMGTAYFDRSRCIPWYQHNDCLVCEEHCPVSDKAIKFDEREVLTVGGEMKLVKFPHVIEESCIGCGICETKCPVVGEKGIFVTSENEVRIQPKSELWLYPKK